MRAVIEPAGDGFGSTSDRRQPEVKATAVAPYAASSWDQANASRFTDHLARLQKTDIGRAVGCRTRTMACQPAAVLDGTPAVHRGQEGQPRPE